jgi:hypothetical protein
MLHLCNLGRMLHKYFLLKSSIICKFPFFCMLLFHKENIDVIL